MTNVFIRWDDAFKAAALARLAELAPGPKCPMCGKPDFTLGDGFVNQHLHAHFLGGIVVQGPIIPSIVVICTTCGFQSLHAIGVLGLLPDDMKAPRP